MNNRYTIIKEMTEAGKSNEEICKRLGISERTLQRERKGMKLTKKMWYDDEIDNLCSIIEGLHKEIAELKSKLNGGE